MHRIKVTFRVICVSDRGSVLALCFAAARCGSDHVKQRSSGPTLARLTVSFYAQADSGSCRTAEPRICG